MKLTKGQHPTIGMHHMQSLLTGWTAGDGSGHEGYHVIDFFDSRGAYRGPDESGIEPIFRDMTDDETKDYLTMESFDQDNAAELKADTVASLKKETAERLAGYRADIDRMEKQINEAIANL